VKGTRYEFVDRSAEIEELETLLLKGLASCKHPEAPNWPHYDQLDFTCR
jgi:hypothetical protein